MKNVEWHKWFQTALLTLLTALVLAGAAKLGVTVPPPPVIQSTCGCK